jgi:hypothetical protein
MKCFDYKTNQFKAVKVIRNKKRFHQQALVEVKLLDHLKQHVSETFAFCLLSQSHLPYITPFETSTYSDAFGSMSRNSRQGNSNDMK